MKHDMRQKRKQTGQVIAIIGVILAIFATITMYNNYKDKQMDEYARENHCTWVINGAHDICK